MNRVDLVNGLAAVAAVGLSVFFASRDVLAGRGEAEEHREDTVTDATGVTFPVARYHRIVSSSSVADSLLFELIEPDRIAAVSAYGRENDPRGYRYAGKPTIASLEDVETILTLDPDLVIVNNVAQQARVARLRELGVPVFDLGPLEGLESFVEDTRALARLVGVPERGERLASSFRARMERVAIDVPADRRPPAIYLSALGGHLYGGTRGTSQHDVLTSAGLTDAAAERFRGYPEYDPESLLAIDPELVITRHGMRGEICAHPGMHALAVCADPAARILELDGDLLDDPGFGMLDAAEMIRERVHPPAR
jgi:iron complex transport system substrate-binding protein